MENVIIERIDITAFGGLSAVSISPAEGMNILECPNESGKSSVAAFIKFVLYGFKGRGHSIGDNPKKMYSPWSGATPCGSLTLRVGERRIRVERNGDKLTSTDLQSGGKLFDGLCPGEEIFGMGAELFEKSAFLSSLDRIENKDEDMAKSMQSLFADNDSAEQADSAVRLLTKHKNALQGKAGAGEIPATERLISQLSDRFERELDSAKERNAIESELESIEKNAAAREADMERLAKERTNADNYEAVLLLEEYGRLKAARDSAAEELHLAEDNAPTESEIKLFKKMKKDADGRTSLLSAERQAAEAKNKGAKKKAVLFFVFAVVLAVAAGALFALSFVIPAVISAVVAVGCSAVGAFFATQKTAMPPNSSREYRELDKLMASYGGSADSFDADIERMTEAMHKAEKSRIVLEEKQKNLAAFEARNNIEELSRRSEGAEKPTRDRSKIEFEYQFALKSAMGLRQKESEKKSRLAVLKAEGADPSATETELAAAKESLRKMRLRYSALCLAIEGLNDAQNELRGGVVPRLAGLTAKLFSKLTDGKYGKLELDNRLFVSFETGFGMKSAEHLSAGTREGLYLCLRLAFMQMLYGNAKIPAVFDDALSKQDNERLSAMLSLICDEGRQFILMCCTDRERKALDALGRDYKMLSI